ncbi:hypothetical protein L211DRAFT_31339 [Terfezia boudieri ATCC MYA-4762]|uniref:Uncharacterized protein n=1 Tax=Terfezia boudieri ATCC MYA-4762 TaxID=1051890 RepID=A0A3N4M7E0_9PEZI|nr:hypothetical protein L211DRAFT_31339 [Terfezia boudieri ATCC MYA-4762]
MEQWIGQVSALASQVSNVGVDVLDNRIAHRILNSLGQQFMNLKPSLSARSGVLFSQQLLAAENDYLEAMAYSEYSATSIGSWSWNSQHGWIE